jgi:hypothetical protein
MTEHRFAKTPDKKPRPVSPIEIRAFNAVRAAILALVGDIVFSADGPAVTSSSELIDGDDGMRATPGWVGVLTPGPDGPWVLGVFGWAASWDCAVEKTPKETGDRSRRPN